MIIKEYLLSFTKIDLVLHPVRLRILQALTAESLTTQQISERLKDVPTSSIYRHLKLLLANELVIVSETRPVRGLEEKFYRSTQLAQLGANDLAGLTAVDHIRYFTTYTLTLLQGFSSYVEQAEIQEGVLDFIADRVGYTEVAFWATPEELDEAIQAMNQALLPLLQNSAGNGRRQHKLATISHPILAGE